MEIPPEITWVSPQVRLRQGVMESPGLGKRVLARLMKNQIWHTSADSVGGGLSKGIVASISTSAWEIAAPLTHALKPDNSVSPCFSLVPFKMLPHY